MKDMKSLYHAMKYSTGSDRDKAFEAFNQRVDEISQDPSVFLSNLEYIIRTSHGLESLRNFRTKWRLPIHGYLVLEDTANELMAECTARNLPQADIYKQLAEEAGAYLNKHQHAVAMYNEFKDTLPPTYFESYYASNGFKDPSYVNKYGIGIIPDAILSMPEDDVPVYLDTVRQNMIMNTPDKQQWLMEATKVFDENPAIKAIRDKISPKSLAGLIKSKRLKDQIEFRESVIMNNENTVVTYTKDDIDHFMDFASFNESLAMSLRTDDAIQESMNEAYAAHMDLDGLVTESGDIAEEACVDVAGMLPGTSDQMVTEEAISHKKHGYIPTYLSKNHDLHIGEEDDPSAKKDEDKSDDYSRPDHSEDDDDNTPATSSSYDDEPEEKEEPAEKKSNTGVNNYYYYNYMNSFNKNQSSKTDNSTKNVGTDNSSHVTNDHSSNVSSKNKDTSITAKESAEPWSLDIFDEEMFCESTSPDAKEILNNLKVLKKMVTKKISKGIIERVKKYNKKAPFLGKIGYPALSVYYVDYDRLKPFNVINSLTKFINKNVDGLNRDATGEGPMSQYVMLAVEIAKEESINDDKAFKLYTTFLDETLKDYYDAKLLSRKETGDSYTVSIVYTRIYLFINADYIINGFESFDSFDSFDFFESANGSISDANVCTIANKILDDYSLSGGIIPQTMKNRYDDIKGAVCYTLDRYLEGMQEVHKIAKQELQLNPFFNAMRVGDPSATSDFGHHGDHDHGFRYLENKDGQMQFSYDIAYIGYKSDFVDRLKAAGKNEAEINEYLAILESEWTNNFDTIIKTFERIQEQAKALFDNRVIFEIKEDRVRHEGAFAELTMTVGILEGDYIPYVESAYQTNGYKVVTTHGEIQVRDGMGKKVHVAETDDDAYEWIEEQKAKTESTENANLLNGSVFNEASETSDGEENDDPEKPKSDHPVKDTLQDIDRRLTKTGAEAKRKVNDAINVGKAAAKPFKRTAGWINNLIARFKDADETRIKEDMADPRHRSAIYKGLRSAIKMGAFYKAGLLTNPLFLFLAVTKKIQNKKNMVRIRNEMTGELKTEIEVLEEKIKDADYHGDRSNKYKMIRLKNELQKKLIRVAGDKATAKVL